MKGRFCFKALTRPKVEEDHPQYGWKLSQDYFFSKEEAEAAFNRPVSHYDIIWPIEVMDAGCVYSPSSEEVLSLNSKESVS